MTFCWNTGVFHYFLQYRCQKRAGEKKQIVHIFLGGLPEFSHSDTAACFSPIGAKPNLIMDLLSMGEKHIIIVGTVYKYHW